MSFRRMLNSSGIFSATRSESLFLVLVVIVILVMYIYSQILYEQNSKLLCRSEINLHSTLNKSGIHVIPSVPEKRGWFQDDSDQVAGKFNPFNHECVDYETAQESGTLLICIHDPKKDLMVSAHLKKSGTWEAENVETLYEAHRRFPDIVLVDLGCNLGVFTLPAAKIGMEVVAVDSMLDSLKLLQRSLFINGLSCHVTLIHNALHRKKKQMRVALDPSNIGGSQVVEILEFRRDKINPSQLVDAICLDDLVPLVKGKTVFLKLDLEGAERAVLECADNFFKQVNVKVLLLEWMHYRHSDEDSGFIKSFLDMHHMVPTWGLDMDRYIDPLASHSWPDNVFWMKRD